MRLKDPVPDEVKQERLNRVVAVQDEIARRKREALIGTRVRVLIDGQDPESGLLYGRHDGQAPEIDDVVYFSGNAEFAGNFCKVEIINVQGYDLVGRLVSW